MPSKPFTPRVWQEPMIEHARKHRRWGLWASMGSGKTSAVLMVLDELRLLDEDMPALIIAPKRVARDTWPDEVHKWDELKDLKIKSMVGTEQQRLAALRCALRGLHDVYTINYENLPWLVENTGAAWPFKTVIADEATKLKGFRLRKGSSRARALARVAWTKVKRFGELTGTPAPNGLKDLWGQAWFLDQGEALYGTYTRFVSRWFEQNHNGHGITPTASADKQIHEALGDTYLTIDMKDYLPLDTQIEHTVKVELPEDAQKHYNKMEAELFFKLEETEVEAFNAAARTIKCLQIANGSIYTDDKQNWLPLHDAKLEALDEIIEEANGAPVIVVYHFKPDLIRLQKAYPDGVLLSDAKGMAEFKAGRRSIAFGHPASVGHGVDGLQNVCNIIVFYAHWWTADERQQIIDRIGPVRQMQSNTGKHTYVYNIVAKGTIDEDVLLAHKSKMSVQDALMLAKKRKHKGTQK